MKSPSYYKDQTQGTFGDANAAHLSVTLAAAASGTVIELGVFQPGCLVVDAKMIAGALGADTTLALGHRPVGGVANASTFLAAAASSSAGTRRSDAAPVEFDEKTEVILTVGGATATGQVDVVLYNVFKGK